MQVSVMLWGNLRRFAPLGVGSAAFLRRRTQSGMSIWTPPAGGGVASSSSQHRKPFAAIPKAPRPTLRADDPRPAAPPGDAERL